MKQVVAFAFVRFVELWTRLAVGILAPWPSGPLSISNVKTMLSNLWSDKSPYDAV